jgi:hypothetical protein
MNNIQREYKNFVIKDILPILYKNILSINNGENEEYEKNIEFQLKIIEIISQANKEYYQKAS